MKMLGLVLCLVAFCSALANVAISDSVAASGDEITNPRIALVADIGDVAPPLSHIISTPNYEIASSGTYVVTKNLSGCIRNCINVSASDVVLNCANHLLDGEGSAAGGVYVKPGYTNVTVKNCTLTDFVQYGIFSSDSDSLYFLDNRISQSGVGIQVERAGGAEINGNRVEDNDGWGIFVGDTISLSRAVPTTRYVNYDVEINDNWVEENGGSGIYLYSANGATISSNQVYGNSEDGIRVLFSTSASVTQNVVRDSEGTANIYVYRSSDSSFEENVAYNSDNNSKDGVGCYGFYVYDASGNYFTDNEAHGTTVGFYLNQGNSKSSISGNSVYSNSYGFYMNYSNSTNVSGNTITNNDVGLYTYYLGTGNTISNNAFERNGGDIEVERGLLPQIGTADKAVADYTYYMNVFNGSTVSFAPLGTGSLAANSVDSGGVDGAPDGYRAVGRYISFSGLLKAVPAPVLAQVDMAFHYTSREAGDYRARDFVIAKYNGSDWVVINTTVNTTERTVKADLARMGTYGLFGIKSSGGGGGGGSSDPDLEISKTTSCPGNKLAVLVESEGDEIDDAYVRLFKNDVLFGSGHTNSSGKVIFTLNGDGTYYIEAEKENYDSDSLQFSYTACSDSGNQTEGECASDSECAYNQYCDDSECVNITIGTCGMVEDHEWVEFECCSDSDCSAGEGCRNNTCTILPEENNTQGQAAIAQEAIGQAQSEINKAKTAGKNTTEAERIFALALSAYDAGNFEEATTLAGQAKALALSASGGGDDDGNGGGNEQTGTQDENLLAVIIVGGVVLVVVVAAIYYVATRK